jgi:integrase
LQCQNKDGCFPSYLEGHCCEAIEAWVLRWTDIDFANKCITVTPAKYSHARKLRLSEQTVNLLSSLDKRSLYVFSPSGDRERFADELEHFATCFVKLRKRVADKLKNPRLNIISLKTFRHWKATKEYLRTKDILHVMDMLGHKNI